MPVTTGSTTSNTNKTSTNPSGGGPGGGSLSAPARTAPSTGTGGQGSGSSSSKTSSTSTSTASKASTSASTAKAPASSGTSKSSNPTGGSLSAPARTAPSAGGGITSRTPSEQAAVDKAKQSYSQYGGAQTSMRNATTGTAKTSTTSAKVTDPSRGLTSPMSGQGTSFKTPESAKKANDQYIDRNGFYNRAVKGMPSAAEDVVDLRGTMGPFKGPLDYGLMPDRHFGPFNPNAPYTKQQYDRDWQKYREQADTYWRGTIGVGSIDDYDRTPQEVREQVQREIDREYGIAGERARREAKEQAQIEAALGVKNPRSNLGSITPDISFSQGLTRPGAPQSNLLDKTDRQRTAAQPSGTDTAWGGPNVTPQTSAPGKTDRQPSPTVARPSGTDTAWGGPNTTPQTTAQGKTSSPYAKTDREPSPTVARPSGTDTAWGGPNTTPQTVDRVGKVSNPASYVDSLGLDGSIMGMMRSARDTLDPSKVMAQGEVYSNFGPRAGVTPAAPNLPSDVVMSKSDGTTSMADVIDRVQQGRLLSGYGPPEPKIADRLPQEDRFASPQPIGDPRVAQLQEQFERIKQARGQVAADRPISIPGDPRTPPMQSIPEPKSMKMVGNPTLSPTNPFGALPPAQAARLASLQTRVAVDDLLNGTPPAEAPAPAVPQRQGVGNVFNRHTGIGGLISAVKLASDKARGVGGQIAPTADRSLSQDGANQYDENFTQYDGQPQDLGELKNRGEYEYDRAKQNLVDLPGRLWDAITKGEITGYTPTQNDRGVERRFPPPSTPEPKMSRGDAEIVARLAALILAMQQQESSGLTQADLVNSTFQ